MLKIRVMPTMLYREFGLVKGVAFDSWRRTGGVMQAVRVYNLREVDELVLLDIRATLEGREPDYQMVDEVADECFMPLTVGGGVSAVKHVRRLLQVGADKVAINTAAVESPPLIRELADEFGSQCIVISIDFRRGHNGKACVHTHSGTRPTDLDPIDFARQMEDARAGEILLTSIDRDGTMRGYDVEMTTAVSEAVSIPVIASGGAGEYQHMVDVLRESKAAAIAAASIFHFTQQTPLEAKRYMHERGLAVRL
jgi:imidazole glycerol-phosphate synthase subunit HisF